MSISISYTHRIFDFNFPAKTSRGAMAQKKSYFLTAYDDKSGIRVVGECSFIEGLSVDRMDDYVTVLQGICAKAYTLSGLSDLWRSPLLDRYPSIRFGVEMLYRQLYAGQPYVIFPNRFMEGVPIPINGLVWMGDKQFMYEQLKKKIASGFRCMKFKIGGIDFEEECELLAYVRAHFSPAEVEIRLDANGALGLRYTKVLEKLDRLSEYHIHSIEQPVHAGHLELSAQVCAKSPIPVALDEELIGVVSQVDIDRILDTIKPSYVILKPSLIGGFDRALQWIDSAKLRDIAWWTTSALESNLGLNAIAQFAFDYQNGMPQGLGTGQLYLNNIPSPLVVSAGSILYDAELSWGAV